MTETIDHQALSLRDKMFQERRISTIISQYSKHFTKSCNCERDGKVCNFNGIIDLSKLGNNTYVKSIMNELLTLYNSSQSITQSYRSTTGKDFEIIICKILTKSGIPFVRQWYVNPYKQTLSRKRSRGCYTIDIIVPIPYENAPVIEYELISCKTKLRERYLQDKFLRTKYTLISLEKLDEDDVNSIQVKENGTELQNWIEKLKNKYNLI